MAGAFQSNAFQNNAFQVDAAACIPSFQTNAFQTNAFQTCGVTTTTQPSQMGGSGGWKKRRDKERAKLIWSLLPQRQKKEEIVEAAIEQALEAVPSAPVMSEAAIEQAALMLLQEQSLSALKRIKYAETLIDRVQRVMAEIDDEEVILMALH